MTKAHSPALIAAAKPHRVQLSRKKGWRLPENTVVVSRPSKWGNPHDWRDWREDWNAHLPAQPHDGEISRDDWCKGMAVQAFEEDLRDGVIVLPVEELRGKNLACWCRVGGWPKSCHADVLLELANREPQPPSEEAMDDRVTCSSCGKSFPRAEPNVLHKCVCGAILSRPASGPISAANYVQAKHPQECVEQGREQALDHHAALARKRSTRPCTT